MREYSVLKRLHLRVVKSFESLMARRRQAEERKTQPKSWRERT